MTEIKVEITGETKRLTMGGGLTVEHAGELRSALSEIPDNVKDISVRLKDVTSVDVAILQLICSAHRASEAENRLLSLDGAPSEPFLRAARNAGFVRYSCGFAKDTTVCLWTEGTDE